jgi:hypothetical protein
MQPWGYLEAILKDELSVVLILYFDEINSDRQVLDGF